MPTGTTRIRLRPANSSRLSFWAQLALVLFAATYSLLMLYTEPEQRSFNFLHYVFLAGCLGYLIFILVHNAPVFGTQSYLEFAPGYLVHKAGLFRPKQVFAAENLQAVELRARQLRLRQKDGEIYALNLREIRGTRRRGLFRQQLAAFAQRHGVALVEEAGR